jgi:hypothetical protein
MQVKTKFILNILQRRQRASSTKAVKAKMNKGVCEE